MCSSQYICEGGLNVLLHILGLVTNLQWFSISLRVTYKLFKDPAQSSPYLNSCLMEGRKQMKNRGLILSVENKGRDVFPLPNLRTFTLETL